MILIHRFFHSLRTRIVARTIFYSLIYPGGQFRGDNLTGTKSVIIRSLINMLTQSHFILTDFRTVDTFISGDRKTATIIDTIIKIILLNTFNSGRSSKKTADRFLLGSKELFFNKRIIKLARINGVIIIDNISDKSETSRLTLSIFNFTHKSTSSKTGRNRLIRKPTNGTTTVSDLNNKRRFRRNSKHILADIAFHIDKRIRKSRSFRKEPGPSP